MKNLVAGKRERLQLIHQASSLTNARRAVYEGGLNELWQIKYPSVEVLGTVRLAPLGYHHPLPKEHTNGRNAFEQTLVERAEQLELDFLLWNAFRLPEGDLARAGELLIDLDVETDNCHDVRIVMDDGGDDENHYSDDHVEMEDFVQWEIVPTNPLIFNKNLI